MPNGNKLVGDLDVLIGFAEPFIVDGVPRDERMAKRWGLCVKQVYAIWNKRRFSRLIEYGVTFRSGWLTPEGKALLWLYSTEPRKPPFSPSVSPSHPADPSATA